MDLSQAKAKLLMEFPVFGHIISRMESSPNPSIRDFVSDGKRFEYNPDFLFTCKYKELRFALAHAALHTILHHATRKHSRDPSLWQLATDYAVSSMLSQSGFEIPPFAKYQKRFDGMYAEEIYALLEDEHTDIEEERTTKEETQPNHNTSHTHQHNDQEIHDRLMQKFIEDTLKKHSDSIPKPIQRFIHTKPSATLPWQNIVRHYMTQKTKEDYTLFPPSKKLLYEGIYLPSLSHETLFLVIAVDVSASIDDALLQTFFDEISSILLCIPSYTIELLFVDDTIKEHHTLTPGSTLPKTFLGGCGTDFRTTFCYISQQRLSCDLLLYFTDLQGRFPSVAPSYTTLWITPHHTTLTPPFGKHLQLTQLPSPT